MEIAGVKCGAVNSSSLAGGYVRLAHAMCHRLREFFRTLGNVNPDLFRVPKSP
jgi:hypothetical protein